MNKTQRLLLSIYLPLTLIILVLDNVYPGENFVRCVKYAAMISLFLNALLVRNKTSVQKIMNLAMLFMVIADFFLVFSIVLVDLKIFGTIFGMVGFMAAYLCLIFAYQKNFRFGKQEIITLIIVTGIFLIVFLNLKKYVELPMLIATLIFGAVLCYMTWTAICTVFRGWYRPAVARMIALSGILMFICDMGVAFSLFHPVYSSNFTSWLENIIWLAYVPGWTLLAVVIAEKSLKKEVSIY